jgi:hypothetical protein
MSPKSLMLSGCLTALTVVGAAPPAPAQTAPTPLQRTAGPSTSPRAHARIEVNPRPLLYRRCVDWYELQHRPSGTVLYPQQHCWWVRG